MRVVIAALCLGSCIGETKGFLPSPAFECLRTNPSMSAFGGAGAGRRLIGRTLFGSGKADSVVERLRGGGAPRGSSLPMATTTSGGGVSKPSSSNPVDAYLDLLDKYPLTTKMVTSGIICVIGDVGCQARKLGGLNQLRVAFDAARTIQFGLIGALYLAPLVHIWYGWLEKLFGGKKPVNVNTTQSKTTLMDKLKPAFKMVLLDQGIGSPLVNGGFLFLSVVISQILAGSGLGSATNFGVDKIQTTLWPTLVTSWKIWPAANFINFAFVPAHLRVLFVNVVGVFWNIILSDAVNG